MPLGATKGVQALAYKPVHCQEVVEFMGRGYSLTAFAGEIGVSRATLDKWIQKHAPFARAVERGKARRARVLEDRLMGTKGSAAFGLHMEALKTAAPDDWQDRSGAKGGAKARGPERRSADIQLDLPDNGRDC